MQPQAVQPPIQIETANRAKILHLAVKADRPTRLLIFGVDANDRDTWYIYYTADLREGVNLIDYPMPVSPHVLELHLDVSNDALVGIVPNSISYKGTVHTKPIALPADVREYVDVSLEFALRASHEPLDVYYSKKDADGNSVVIWEYKDVIKLPNANGVGEFVASTPAATYVDTGNMWISKQYFQGMTVPVRFFTLLHEHAHHALGIVSDTKDPSIEQRCDLWAVDIFVSMGFTERDLQALIGQALTDTPTNRRRVEIIRQRFEAHRVGKAVFDMPAEPARSAGGMGMADPVGAIAQAVGSVTQSIAGVLGMKQQRLAQESADETAQKALETQVQLSQEEYWKQISGQNREFADRLLSLEEKKVSLWNTPIGIALAVGLPLLAVVLIVWAIKNND